MDDKILVHLSTDHAVECDDTILGRAGEGNVTRLEITIPEKLHGYSVYIDFETPSGETFRTPKLSVSGDVAYYDVVPYLLSIAGEIKVQVVFSNDSNTWKSTKKKFHIQKSINASNDIPEKEDFIYELQKILDEFSGEIPEIVEALSNDEEFLKNVANKSLSYEWEGTTLHITTPNGTYSADLKGADGQNGKDGYTPVKGVDYFDGRDGQDGKDGYTPVKGVDYFDGINGKDGKDGHTPVKGVDYFDGRDGKDGENGLDGVSPTITVSTITGGHRISITDKNETKTVDVIDGSDGTNGTNGTNGKDGRGIKTVARTSGTGANGTTDTYTITYTDNTTNTFSVYNGKNGTNGTNGKDGKTAYQYAQDGGYTGTEREFAKKLADKSYVTPQMYEGTDAEKIQQAINASNYVVIPEGNYTISSTVTIPSNKKIQIEGRLTINCAVGFLIQGETIQICGNGTLAINSSIAECTVIKVVVDRSIGFVNIDNVNLWGVWNYNNSNNHIGVEFVGSSTAGTCCYVNINCNINCMTKAIWTHKATSQNANSWLTQIDVNSTIQNCLQAVAYEWGGDASRIRGVIQPKCTSNVTPNSIDLPLCILPEQTYMDAMVWDMHAAMNKYAVKVTGKNVTVLSELNESYMDLTAAIKTTLMLRMPTENLATKEYVEKNKPTLNVKFRIDENGNLIMEENAPFLNLMNGIGYKDNYRLNSAGEEKAQAGTVLTDLIPFNDVSDADMIRTKGVTYPAELYCGIVFYDKNHNNVAGLRLIEGTEPSIYGSTTSENFLYTAGTTFTVDEKGIATIKVNFKEESVIATPIAYFRLFAKGKGSDLVVTRNEEIVEYDANGEIVGKVATKTSELKNDSGYIDQTQMETYINEAFLGGKW